MRAARVEKPFDVVEHVGACFVARVVDFAGRASVFKEEKKLSIAELSQTLPALLNPVEAAWQALLEHIEQTRLAT